MSYHQIILQFYIKVKWASDCLVKFDRALVAAANHSFRSTGFTFHCKHYGLLTKSKKWLNIQTAASKIQFTSRTTHYSQLTMAFETTRGALPITQYKLYEWVLRPVLFALATNVAKKKISKVIPFVWKYLEILPVRGQRSIYWAYLVNLLAGLWCAVNPFILFEIFYI